MRLLGFVLIEPAAHVQNLGNQVAREAADAMWFVGHAHDHTLNVLQF